MNVAQAIGGTLCGLAVVIATGAIVEVALGKSPAYLFWFLAVIPIPMFLIGWAIYALGRPAATPPPPHSIWRRIGTAWKRP